MYKRCSEQLGGDPDNPYLHSTLALAYLALGEEDEAGEEAKIAEKLAPENGAILYDMARFHSVRNDEERAIDFLLKALQHPLSPSKYEIRLDPHFKSLRDSMSLANLLEI